MQTKNAKFPLSVYAEMKNILKMTLPRKKKLAIILSKYMPRKVGECIREHLRPKSFQGPEPWLNGHAAAQGALPHFAQSS